MTLNVMSKRRENRMTPGTVSAGPGLLSRRAIWAVTQPFYASQPSLVTHSLACATVRNWTAVSWDVRMHQNHLETSVSSSSSDPHKSPWNECYCFYIWQSRKPRQREVPAHAPEVMKWGWAQAVWLPATSSTCHTPSAFVQKFTNSQIQLRQGQWTSVRTSSLAKRVHHYLFTPRLVMESASTKWVVHPLEKRLNNKSITTWAVTAVTKLQLKCKR